MRFRLRPESEHLDSCAGTVRDILWSHVERSSPQERIRALAKADIQDAFQSRQQNNQGAFPSVHWCLNWNFGRPLTLRSRFLLRWRFLAFFQSGANVFERFDVQLFAQSRDFVGPDVADNVDEQNSILWINHCDRQTRQCFATARFGVNANVLVLLPHRASISKNERAWAGSVPRESLKTARQFNAGASIRGTASRWDG